MSSLDPTLLQKARRHASGKVIARCPACAETGNDRTGNDRTGNDRTGNDRTGNDRTGNDRTGNHLAIFPDGRFACAAHPGDSDHRKRIHALVGNIPAPSSRFSLSERREWKQQAARDEQQRKETAHLTELVKAHRQALISRYPWHPYDVWEDSPQPIDDDVATCPRHFLATLFPPDALIWTGEVHHSGTSHRHRWKTCMEWQTTTDPIGPMTTPAIWQPGTHSRTATQVRHAPYTVLDFDGFDGTKPTTPEELDQHLHASLALIRWLREGLHWQPAAILHTGGKSLHAWFHTPQSDVLTTLRQAAAPLGIDAGLIGRPEHPCRLPGQVHQGTGNLSRVMWI